MEQKKSPIDQANRNYKISDLFVVVGAGICVGACLAALASVSAPIVIGAALIGTGSILYGFYKRRRTNQQMRQALDLS